MPIILKIHYTKVILPDTANVNAILKELKGGVLVDEEKYVVTGIRGKSHYYRGDKLEVQLNIVSSDMIHDKSKPKQIPEKASKDCNGKDFFKPDEK